MRYGSRSARSSCRLEVARLENQLHSLLEHLNVGVFRATSDGRLLESNQAFLRLFDASNLADVQGIYLQQLFVQPLDSGRAVSGQPRGDCPYGKPGFCRGGATPTPRARPAHRRGGRGFRYRGNHGGIARTRQ
ncbi:MULTISPECIES: PAS domain-containing protein [unclassified Microcoleus]|uniref:PAS domain-containing protein n=1 Tax=unclassified Microcoleus TaxID=2642155 RepID=UPI004040AFCA